ncbi:MAG: AEC family transporter [Pseudomonadota bacterium]
MSVALRVLEIVAPVFLLAAVGYVWVRQGLEYHMTFVTRLATVLALPCLIFTALMKTEIDKSALASLSLAALAAYGAVALVIWVLVRVLNLNPQTYLAPLVFGNTGNLGLPIALFAFGDVGLSYAVVVFAVMIILSFTVGIWMITGETSPLKILRDPVVVATLLGAVFLWFGWETPVFLTHSLDLIGQMAIPLMLVTLGVAVARLHPRRVVDALGLSLAKFVICVGLAWGIGLGFGLPPVPLAILVLQVATPVAVTNYLLAEKYDTDPETVAGLVVVSTLVSVAGLPLILAAFV